MGWSKVCELNHGYSLWTRGGLEGVEVQQYDTTGRKILVEIPIPKRALLALAADEIQNRRISDLEEMSVGNILGMQELDDVPKMRLRREDELA